MYDRVLRTATAGGRSSRFDQGRQDELVQEAREDAVDSPIQVLPEFRGDGAIPVVTEPAVAVVGADEMAGKKKRKAKNWSAGAKRSAGPGCR
jgi:hypothetical protein